jgi:hypothetical protein
MLILQKYDFYQVGLAMSYTDVNRGVIFLCLTSINKCRKTKTVSNRFMYLI